ncbi:MAG: ZIP family metal transporter [Gemmatimonadota bacterium]
MLGWPGVVLFAVLAGGAGLAGVWLMWRHERWARRHTGQLVTFASGLLVSGSLLHLLSRAGAMAGVGPAMGWALAAFVGLYVAENHFLPHPHARSEDGCHPRSHGEEGRHPHTGGDGGGHPQRPTVGAAAVLGLGLHSVLDGIAVGAGFSASWLTGGVIVSLVVSHKLPVGIASMGVLYHSGLARGRAVRYSSAVALLTPVAVLTSYALLRTASPSFLGALVAAAGGSFLYVGAADLLPEGQASGVGKNTLLFLLGVAAMIVVLVLFPGEAAS